MIRYLAVALATAVPLCCSPEEPSKFQNPDLDRRVG